MIVIKNKIIECNDMKYMKCVILNKFIQNKNYAN